ncbi:Hypothetical protein, putative [Bodo saltans]|uniref:Uncharacterized protein n=1 Tax=Bodo saltans TaxID=75058 RepID=A0A0S4JFZ1_BODSA|nr:Hypothetical protein, putative [Bodo saltans]|eukprot:CUG89030.1 Hypothetical protein, putative [Bodo saltans]
MHKNNNSFLQRQQSHCTSAHVASNPVRNSFGGYLRSPFDVATDILGTAKVGNGLAQRAIEVRAETHENGAIAERPWVRAGVGATRLSTKEKNEQLHEAKQIYGDWGESKSSSNSNGGTSSSTTSLPVTDATATAAGISDAQKHSSSNNTASSAQEEKRYVHRTVGESKMLPKLLPSGVGAVSLKKRPRDESSAGGDTAHNDQDDSDLKGSVKGQSLAAAKIETTGVVLDAAPSILVKSPASLSTLAAPVVTAPQGTVNLSKRQEMEKKRLEALYGNGKKRR